MKFHIVTSNRFPQFIRIAKLSFIFLLMFTLNLTAGSLYSQNQRLTLNLKNVPLSDVFAGIESKSEFSFLFSPNEIDLSRKVSVAGKDLLIADIMETVFKGQDIAYRIDDRHVILYKPESEERSAAGLASKQQAQKTITGKVIESSGEPIHLANIVVKGSSSGAWSNEDGTYAIVIPSNVANPVLVFSYLGFKQQEISVGDRAVINVTLLDDISLLDEVVVIGYGVQKKKLVTGATVQVKGDDISKLNTVSTLGALQGQTPGVNIVKENGKPGEGFKVTIRGLGTIWNSSPLYIIDGVVGADINLLNPTDIESVDVLKDAASAAIYGARAANGVILVTTKQGRAGKVNIQYDGYYGWQNVYKKAPLLNAQEYATLMNEGRLNDGLPPWDFAALVPDWDKIQAGTWNGTNWMDEITNENAPLQNHALNFTGGSEKSVYSIGLAYTSQEGLIGGNIIDSKYERITTRINTEHILIKHKDFDLLKIGENLSMAYTDRKGLDVGTGDMYWNDVNNALKANPFQPVYNEDGTFHGSIPWYPEEMNPVASLYYSRGNNLNTAYYMKGNLYLTLQPIKNLKYRTSFSTTFNSNVYRSYGPSYYLDGKHYRDNGEDQVTENMSTGLGWLFDNTLTYDFSFHNTHNFSAMIGTSAEKTGLGDNIGGGNINAIFKDFKHAYLSNTKEIITNRTTLSGSPWGRGAVLSYFGRINYDYKETYMASFTMRADGSSNFAKGHQWGYFPSVSAGWTISNEAFMESTRDWLEQLKLRASWGQNGNQSIPAFQYQSTFAFTGVDYFFGTNKAKRTVGAYPDILANPDVTWETSEQLDFGLDARLLNNRMTFTFDWYNKITRDWLVQAPILATYGTNPPYINGGDVRNRGMEFSLGWNDHISDFSYGINANLAYNQNKVLKIANDEGIIHGNIGVLAEGVDEFYRAQVGYPIGYFFGYKTNGIFQSEEEVQAYTGPKGLIQPDARPGDLRYIDRDGSGDITPNDRTMLGNPHPDYLFGLSFNTAWKGFDLSVTTSGTLGNQIAKSYRSFTASPRQNYTTEIFERWHGPGTSNTIPRLTSGTHIDWQYVSERFFEDGDYWRISNVTLGYDFKRLWKQLPLQQMRLYMTVQNIYTFTKYSGMDPEIGYGFDNSWVSGIDLGYYPTPRTFMIGASIKF